MANICVIGISQLREQFLHCLIFGICSCELHVMRLQLSHDSSINNVSFVSSTSENEFLFVIVEDNNDITIIVLISSWACYPWYDGSWPWSMIVVAHSACNCHKHRHGNQYYHLHVTKMANVYVIGIIIVSVERTMLTCIVDFWHHVNYHETATVSWWFTMILVNNVSFVSSTTELENEFSLIILVLVADNNDIIYHYCPNFLMSMLSHDGSWPWSMIVVSHFAHKCHDHRHGNQYYHLSVHC